MSMNALTAPSLAAEPIQDDQPQDNRSEFSIASAVDWLCQLAGRTDALAHVTIEGTAARVRTVPTVTAETITDDELRALRDEAIASRDDGMRNIACGALNAVDEFQRFACRKACADVLNTRRDAEGA